MILNLSYAKLKQPALIGLATCFVLNLQACQVTTDKSNHSQRSSVSNEQHHFSPSQLRTELMQGQQLNHIQDTQPEFSWVLPAVTNATEQTAYQIQLVSAGDAFQNQQKIIWDSGFVNSAQSLSLSYAGPSLNPSQSYQWRVRVKTQPLHINKKIKNSISAWSVPQTFTLASSPSLGTSTYELTQTSVEPVSVTVLESGNTLIDFGKVAFGYLDLQLTAEQAGKITIHMGERGNENGIIRQFHQYSSVRYYPIELNVYQGQDTYGVHPPRNTKNNKQHAIEIPGKFGRIAPFRYIEIEANDIDISQIKAKQIAVHYPFDEFQSKFSSNNDILNQIWELCKYSMKATSFAGVYVDGDRERIPYEADAYINQLSHYYVDSEYTLARHSHEYLLENPTWPTEWKQHSVMMAWADWMYTGDLESLQANFDILKREKTLEKYETDNGLLSTFPKRLKQEPRLGDIVDWPKTERDNYDFKPVNTVVNAFYYLNLKQMAEMALALGKQQQHEFYQAKAKRVFKQFNALLFSPESKLYVDGLGSEHSAAHANIIALAFGLVPENRKAKVLDFVISKDMAVSVYFAQYLLEALYLNGAPEHALALMTSKDIRSWYNMIRAGSTITMEAWDDKFKPNQDWNHAWGAVPGNIIGRFVLGVQPKTPGFETILISPQPADLKKVSGIIPTIRGNVSVAIEQNLKQSFTLNVSIPGNSKAEVILPVDEKAEIESVTLNGKKIKYSVGATGVELKPLASGQHQIKLTYL